MHPTNELDRLWENELEMANIFKTADGLCVALSKYVRLRQVPRFFSALFYSLNATSDVKNDFYVLFPINFCRKLVEELLHLPAGQILEIWNLCRTNASSLLNKTGVREGEISCIQFHLSFEIFRLFLLHVKIETERNESLNELFKNTAAFLKEALEICGEVNYEDQFVFPVLGMCHAWGEFSLAMKQYAKDFKHPGSLADSSHIYDLSSNHYYASSQNWINTFARLSDNKDKRTHYFATLLLLQKARTLMFGGGHLLDSQAITDIIDYVFKSLKSLQFVEENIMWNGEPTYITSETYVVAYWYCILKHVPCLVEFLGKKHWSLLASRIIEVLNTAKCDDNNLSSGHSAFTLTKMFLEGPFFSEIRPLQSTYVTELLKLASEMFQGRKRKLHSDSLSNRETLISHLYTSKKVWISLANTTPKCKDFKSNELWEKVKQASDILNNVLHLKEKEKVNHETLSKLLRLMSYLPLEYLLPGNQMRCLLVLITVMSCIPSMSEKVEKIVLQNIMINICKIILAILDGARSVWLLSFIDISLLLKATIKVSSSILAETSDLQEVLKWIRQLLNSFTVLSMKNTSTLVSLREFTNDVASLLCQECSDAVVICTSVLLSRFNDALCRTHVQQNYDTICKENAQLLISAISRFIENNDSLGDELLTECYREFIHFKCLTNDGKMEILHLQKVIEREFTAFQQGDAVLSDANVKFFTTVSENRELLVNCIPDNFAQKLWFSAMKFYDKQLEESNLVQSTGIISSMSNLIQARVNLVKEVIERSAQNSIPPLTQQFLDTANNNETVSSTREAKILKVSIECATEEEYRNIVQHTVDLTDSIDNTKNVFPVLQIWKIIVASTSTSLHREVLRNPVTNLIMKLCFLVGQKKCPSDRLKISMPVLDFCITALHKGKGLLIHQSILACMEMCVFTPLQSTACHPKLYINVFEKVYDVLNEIMIQHLYCVLCAPSCFLACVSYVLCCQIQASNQNIVIQCDTATQEKLGMCAQKLCKLMNLISEHRTEFSKLIATIIASYVNEVEKVTIFPPIKVHLLIGLNKLIKICDDYVLNVLQNTLKHGSKEIFKTLLSDHKSYFKYHGHV